MNEGTRHNKGKVELHLVSPNFMAEVAEVLTFGTKKYDPWNWTKGFDYTSAYNCAQRHMLAWMQGNDKDEESGLSHLAHAACNMMFLMEFQKTGAGKDDRPKGKVYGGPLSHPIPEPELTDTGGDGGEGGYGPATMTASTLPNTSEVMDANVKYEDVQPSSLEEEFLSHAGCELSHCMVCRPPRASVFNVEENRLEIDGNVL